MVFLPAPLVDTQRHMLLSLLAPLDIQDAVSSFPTFADYVRNRLSAHSVSARHLSKVIGFSHNYVSNGLHRNQVFSGAAVVRIARFFGDEPATVLKLAFDNEPVA